MKLRFLFLIAVLFSVLPCMAQNECSLSGVPGVSASRRIMTPDGVLHDAECIDSNNGRFYPASVQAIATGAHNPGCARPFDFGLFQGPANSSWWVGINFQTGSSGQVLFCNGAGQTMAALVGGGFTNIAGFTAVQPGVPIIVASSNPGTSTGNITAQTLYTIPATGAGTYRISCYLVVSQAATTSSTLPNCQVVYFDADTNIAATANITQTSTGNTLGTTNSATAGVSGMTINAKASTTIQYQTANYASSGATAMQFTTHVKLEFLGN